MLARLGFGLARPFLLHADAENAHSLALKALKLLPITGGAAPEASLSAEFFGLQFPNPLGLAAGFDKNAEVVDQMLSLGFGFVEAGTTTPLPQNGNAKPRLFRLAEDRAVINRMGFNNTGHEAMLKALMNRSRGGIVGVNIGANKDSADRFADYSQGVARFAGLADYLTINVSSPNTPGLRSLQSKNDLIRLLDAAAETQAQISRRAPILVKIAPDLTLDELAHVAEACLGRASGVIISNTTTNRDRLVSAHAAELGGLSGRPLFDLASRQVARFFVLTDGTIPIVGVGGICDPVSAWVMICAGASLLQLYTALVYQGPAVIPEILRGLALRIRENGYKNYTEAVGLLASEIAEGRTPPVYHNGNGA